MDDKNESWIPDDEIKNDEETIGNMMDDVIAIGLENIKDMEVGSDVWQDSIKSVCELTRTYTDFLKVESEYNDRQQQRNHELEMKKLEIQTDVVKTAIAEFLGTAATVVTHEMARRTFKQMFYTNLKCAYIDDKYVIDKMFQNLPGYIVKMFSKF